MADEDQRNIPTQLSMRLPEQLEAGIFADFANVWHTPNTFILDFLVVKQPAQIVQPETGEPPTAVLEAVVGARVRIPSEQIFPLITALQAQGQMWLDETGRSEPPPTWLPQDQQST